MRAPSLPHTLLFAVLASATACRHRAEPQVDRAPVETTAPTSPNTIRPGDPGPVDILVEVDAEKQRKPISPLIYGANDPIGDLDAQRWAVLRNGGNRLTAYNWENNASNAGSDWHFQNDGLLENSDEPAKTMLNHLDAAAKTSAAMILTVPILDYVSADKLGGGDVRQSGPDYLTTRFKRNFATRGKPPTADAKIPDTRDDSVYQDEMVAFVKSKRPKAQLLFSLDNEPELWSHTHAEIFPSPVTYLDLWTRNYKFAKAVKAVAPESPVLGFVSYGYAGYTNLQNAPDANGRNFIEWYLRQAAAAEKREGKRLIDYLDVHWYPEAQGGGERITGEGAGEATVEARLQAPRSLWDSSYREESWVVDAAGGPIDLLHWLQTKIDENYPGTKLAITEWNYGGGNHISGALAVADVLGIYGKYGVGLATYWALSGDIDFALAGFRLYRNYDGKGGEFGNVSVEARVGNTEEASAYASVDDEAADEMRVVVINKRPEPRVVGVAVRSPVAFQGAKTYLLKSDAATVVAGPEAKQVSRNTFRFEMPAYSAAVVELHD